MSFRNTTKNIIYVKEIMLDKIPSKWLVVPSNKTYYGNNESRKDEMSFISTRKDLFSGKIHHLQYHFKKFIDRQ